MCAQPDDPAKRGPKAEAQKQWEARPCGAEGVQGAVPESIEWFREARRVRFDEHAPWIPIHMRVDSISGQAVLEIGAGTDAVPLVRVYSRKQLKSAVGRWFKVESLHATHVGSHRLEVIAKKLGISRTWLERAFEWAGSPWSTYTSNTIHSVP